jgi:hypothetical protein
VVAIEDATGVRGSAPPTDTTFGQLIPIKEGREQCTWLPADESWMALEGIQMFDVPDWGPQSIRMMWFGTALPQGFASTDDGPVDGLANWPGAKVAQAPVGTADWYTFEAIFAYAESHPDIPEFGWDDLEVLPVSGYDEAMDALLAGAVDLAIMTATASDAHELAASAKGIQWQMLPNETAADKAAWTAYREVMPPHFPFYSDEEWIAGASPTTPVQIYGWSYPVVCYDFYPDNMTAYWITQAMDLYYDGYKDAFALLKDWTPDYVFSNMDFWFMPWHEGSIQYWKDSGRWSSEAQAKQDEMLQTYPQTNTK